MTKTISIAALLLIALIVGLSSSLFLMPFWVGPFTAAARNGNPADWIGFAGNFGAGIMTLIAATVAWFAVDRQIKAAEWAAKEEKRTKAVALAIFLYQDINSFWIEITGYAESEDLTDKRIPIPESVSARIDQLYLLGPVGGMLINLVAQWNASQKWIELLERTEAPEADWDEVRKNLATLYDDCFHTRELLERYTRKHISGLF